MAIYTKGKAIKLTNNFNSTEFDCKGKECCKATQIHASLVTYLQLIREHFGKPVTVTSGYRCAKHNKAIGGASASYHTRGQAADIQVKDVEPIEVAKFAESIGIKGIGLYDTFVHIDTRTTKFFWYGHGQEQRTTFNGTTVNKELTKQEQITVSLPVLSNGSNGVFVEVAQCLLGIDADGKFRAGTEKAVKAFQSKQGLAADGIIGAITWGALFKE